VFDAEAARQICRREVPRLSTVPALVAPNYDFNGCVTYEELYPDRTLYPDLWSSIVPEGAGARLGFPRHIPETFYLDVGLPLFLVQGNQEACLISELSPLPVISASFYNGWHDVEHRKSYQTERALSAKRKWSTQAEWRLHPDFADVPFVGRTVYIVADGFPKDQQSGWAETRLWRMLRRAKANAVVVRVPFEKLRPPDSYNGFCCPSLLGIKYWRARTTLLMGLCKRALDLDTDKDTEEAFMRREAACI